MKEELKEKLKSNLKSESIKAISKLSQGVAKIPHSHQPNNANKMNLSNITINNLKNYNVINCEFK